MIRVPTLASANWVIQPVVIAFPVLGSSLTIHLAQGEDHTLAFTANER